MQNQWDIAKAVLRGNFTTIQPISSNKQKNQINHLSTPEDTRKNNNKAWTVHKEGISEDQADKNKIEYTNTIQKISKTKSWFIENINIIDKPLARLIKKKVKEDLNK